MKKKIAVVFGGRSAEHDVSIITAHIPIIRSLLSMGHDTHPIYISKNGAWYSDKEMLDILYFKEEGLSLRLKKQRKIRILFEDGLKLVWPGIRERAVKIDVVFPAMHGTFGEDGSLMGLLRMANVPFVGCDIFASAVAMDKALTKKILEAERIPVVPYVWFTKNDWEKERREIEEGIGKLGWPLFVKPVHLGSSIAISKVKDVLGLQNAIEVAFHYDDKVLVEKSVEDLIEVTLPIMGNEELKLGAIERPLNKTEFLDFKDKYLSGGKKSDGINSRQREIPAKINPELAEKVNELGKKTYRALGCSGTARVDFLIDRPSGSVYVNEVNTLPGNLYHHNWKEVGVSAVDLVSELVRLAEERFASRKGTIYTFDSEILKMSGGPKALD